MTDSSLFGKKDEADSFTLKELLSNIAPGQEFTFTYVLEDLYSMPTNQQLSISHCSLNKLDLVIKKTFHLAITPY